MTTIQLISVILASINCLLAVILAWVYVKNHMEMRSPFTMGLVLFAAFLLVHNAIAVYHYFTMMSDVARVWDNLELLETALQTAASSALVYATLR